MKGVDDEKDDEEGHEYDDEDDDEVLALNSFILCSTFTADRAASSISKTSAYDCTGGQEEEEEEEEIIATGTSSLNVLELRGTGGCTNY